MEFIINDDFNDVRLDKFLKKTYQQIPLSGIFKMIRKGSVKVNKKKKKQNYRLQTGDTVRVWEASSPTSHQEIPLTASEKKSIAKAIIFENRDVILYNKPADLVMHAGSNHPYGLSEMLASYSHNPHLSFVHRIDKMTSGLVLAAKNLPTARILSELIRNHAIKKTYVMVVEGLPPKNNFVYSCFVKSEEDRVRVHSDDSQGAKIAKSHFSVLQREGKRSLLKADLLTGRKHQLRVQLADMGCPIVGDGKYGVKDCATRKMFLFSQSLVVEKLGIAVTLEIPELFYEELTRTR